MTTQIQITGICKPVETRRDGVRVWVYNEVCGERKRLHLDAPSRHKLRRRLRERGATDEMIREAGL